MISSKHFDKIVSQPSLSNTSPSRFWAICVLQLFVNQAVTSGCGINLIFLIKRFCCMAKNSRQKVKYRKKQKAFEVKYKAIFHFFKGLSVVKNYFRRQGAPLSLDSVFRWLLFSSLGSVYSDVCYIMIGNFDMFWFSSVIKLNGNRTRLYFIEFEHVFLHVTSGLTKSS